MAEDQRTREMHDLQLNDEQYDRFRSYMCTPLEEHSVELRNYILKVWRSTESSETPLTAIIADYVRGDSRLTGVPLD